MKLSLFFEMQLADPTPASEYRLFHECVEQAVLADRLGYHAVWAVEHHGLREYAHSSAPETFLAYVAARTENVRLGHGVTLTPARYNHPLRIAERVATLDILSRGRAIWGSGKSGTRTEQGAFEVDSATLADEWLEAQRMIPRIWTEEVFSWEGEHFYVPPTQVVPRPVQDPHPEMYAACSTPASTRAAGELGLGTLNFAAGTPAKLAARVADYRASVAAATPVGKRETNQYACTPMALTLADDKRACEIGFRGSGFFWNSQLAYYGTAERPIGGLGADPGPLGEDELRELRAGRMDPSRPMGAVIGDPGACRDQILQFQEAGVDELILVMQLGTVPSEIVAESVRLFGERVLPHFL